MQRLLTLLVLLVLASPTFAEDPPKPEQPGARHASLSWEQRFAQANVAHDGHLTLEEAKGNYHTIARHFREIDIDSKGYVTENDIRAWHATQKSAHERSQEPENALRPRPAFQQRAYVERPMFNTNAKETVPLSTDTPQPSEAGADQQ